MLSSKPVTLPSRQRSYVQTQALWGKKTAQVVVDETPAPKSTKSKTSSSKSSKVALSKEQPKPRKQESFMTQTLNAFDFSEVRSKQDEELLYEAKYGDLGPNGKMSREQYAALRRKVGGTAKTFFKEWVEDESVKNIKTYYKPNEAGGTVPYLPVLIGVVVAMLGATVAVVLQTQ